MGEFTEKEKIVAKKEILALLLFRVKPEM